MYHSNVPEERMESRTQDLNDAQDRYRYVLFDILGFLESLRMKIEDFRLQAQSPVVSNDVHGIRTTTTMKAADSTTVDNCGGGNVNNKKNNFKTAVAVAVAAAVRVKFPKFNGEDPDGWVFRAERFFEYNHTPEDQWVQVALLHVEGDALEWFRCIIRFEEALRWKEFKKLLYSRFEITNKVADPLKALLKLKQTGTVDDYVTEFVRLLNQIPTSLPTYYLVGVFLKGLNPTIQQDVCELYPHTFSKAVHLARLQEEKHSAKTTNTPTPTPISTTTAMHTDTHVPTATPIPTYPTMSMYPTKSIPVLSPYLSTIWGPDAEQINSNGPYYYPFSPTYSE